jgi:plastocyanin
MTNPPSIRWLRRRGAAAGIAALIVIGIALVPAAPAESAEVRVSITDGLDPAELTVDVGTVVVWTNDDTERHRVRSTSGPTDFDSGNLDPGASFRLEMTTPGDYAYVDDRNGDDPAYHGRIVVTDEPGAGPGDPAPPPSPSGDVEIVDRAFRPGVIEIAAGATVRWVNRDADHTVTARDRSWDSGIFDTGGTFERAFTQPGTFEYFCILHPEMIGTVLVTGGDGGGDGAEPPTEPTPQPDPAPPPEPPPPPATPNGVVIFDLGYSPQTVTIEAGGTIDWVNSGALPHTVTLVGGGFDSGFLFTGDAYSRTFTVEGRYDYLCTIHPEMRGTVVVGAGGDPPDPDPGPDPTPDPGPPPTADPTPVTDPGGTAGGDIRVVDNAFGPATVEVAAGTTLSWVNAGALPHTVTQAGGGFDSGILMPGDAYRRTFTVDGRYEYLCSLHPEMRAVVIVGGGTTTPPPDAEPDPPLTDPEPGIDVGGATVVGADVAILDNAFRAPTIEVAAGTTVSWVNEGDLPHTVTAEDGGFDSGILMPGEGFSQEFTAPGVVDYLCILHPEMRGRIVVTHADVPIDAQESDAQTPGSDPGGTPVEQPTTSGPISAGVVAVDNAFQPSEVVVEVGGTVQWTNAGSAPHTITADTRGFDSGLVPPGGEYVRTFTQPGTFTYQCILHPGMVGTVRVREPAPEPAAALSLPSEPGETLPLSAALLLAGGMVAAMGVFAFGMARFATAAEHGR